MKYLLSALLLFSLGGCASLSKDGKKVEIVTVASTNKSDVDKAVKDLESRKCKFIENIEAKIAAGSSDIRYRLIVGLKNKTAEVGGNTVISSLKSYTGMPIYTKGKVYKCPEAVTSDEV